MGGTRMKTRYLIIYLGKKIYIFQSILTGIWVISQPGDVRSLIWFDHITCPQFSSIPFLHSEIPQDFSFREDRKNLPAPLYVLRWFSIQRKKNSRWKIKHPWKKQAPVSPCFSVIWGSLQPNPFRRFKQVCLTSPKGCRSMETNHLTANRNNTPHLVELSPVQGRPVGEQLRVSPEG